MIRQIKNRPEAIGDTPSPAMRFQDRDGEILWAIYEHDGVMSRRQLWELFWTGKSWRSMEKRLAKLYKMDYLNWPTPEHRRTRPVPEPIVWLGWLGISWIAARSGIQTNTPLGENEHQQQKLETNLRRKGIHWLREPRWALLEHDLAVGDFRLSVEKAIQQQPFLKLEAWVNESVFHARPDLVAYEVRGKDGKPRRLTKRISPDGYFAILDQQHPAQGSAARARFLVEIDQATHDNPSFCLEKVLPGIAYLLSPAYRERFGDNSGRWLVVTTGERRLRNMKRQAERVAGTGAAALYFTTFDKVRPDTVLTGPIWQRGGEDDPVPLFY